MLPVNDGPGWAKAGNTAQPLLRPLPLGAGRKTPAYGLDPRQRRCARHHAATSTARGHIVTPSTLTELPPERKAWTTRSTQDTWYYSHPRGKLTGAPIQCSLHHGVSGVTPRCHFDTPIERIPTRLHETRPSSFGTTTPRQTAKPFPSSPNDTARACTCIPPTTPTRTRARTTPSSPTSLLSHSDLPCHVQYASIPQDGADPRHPPSSRGQR